jgi:hypothetical protein
MWNTVVVQVEWNNPPNIPIPLFKNKKYRLSYEIKLDIIKIVIVALEYSIDLSRLKVIELDNNKAINELSNMSQKRNLNSHY